MSSPAAPARTPGAKRAGSVEYHFELAKVNHIKGGPAYSTAEGACIEGDRMIVALMRMAAGTGAEPHSHPNEQWIYILEGTFKAKIGDKEIEEGRIRNRVACDEVVRRPAAAAERLDGTGAEGVGCDEGAVLHREGCLA